MWTQAVRNSIIKNGKHFQTRCTNDDRCATTVTKKEVQYLAEPKEELAFSWDKIDLEHFCINKETRCADLRFVAGAVHLVLRAWPKVTKVVDSCWVDALRSEDITDSCATHWFTKSLQIAPDMK
jgi:hypothetical protein